MGGMRRTAVAIALVAAAALAPAASGQQPPARNDGPPVGIGGWRYELRGNDIHMFHCEQASCVPPSRVSYRLYAASQSMTLEKFRTEQESIARALQERAPSGTRIILVDVAAKGTGPQRMLVARRMTTRPDGSKEHVLSSLLFGTTASASLISSSHDEKASSANHDIFGLAVMLFINRPREQRS